MEDMLYLRCLEVCAEGVRGCAKGAGGCAEGARGCARKVLEVVNGVRCV